jgi:hypothetical protein
MRESLTILLLLTLATVSCLGQGDGSWSATHGFSYRGFRVRLSRDQLGSTASEVGLHLSCQPRAMPGGVRTLCSTLQPDESALPAAPITRPQLLAGLDDEEHVIYLSFREPFIPQKRSDWVRSLDSLFGPYRVGAGPMWVRGRWLAMADTAPPSNGLAFADTLSFLQLAGLRKTPERP